MANQNFTIPSDLRRRIVFTLAMLAVFRIGVAVPTPGVNGSAVMAFFQAQSAGVFGLLNTFTGGALERFSVLALGIMPYISASIIFQLLQASIPYLEQLSKEGEAGRKKINQYTRYATVALAIIQGYAIASWLNTSSAPDGSPLVSFKVFDSALLPFELVTIVTLTAGTCFIMWIGEQITERGIGNGASLIIFAGIAAGIPSGTAQLWQLVSSGELSGILALALIIGMLLVVAGVVFVEIAFRKIPIQNSQRNRGLKGDMQKAASHLPMKVNVTGVIPPIFASSVLMVPATMTQFTDAAWLQSIQNYIGPTGSLYNVLFVGMIAFFCFFSAELYFKPNDVSDNLKKSGSFIPGIRAGKSTSDYLMKVLNRLTVAGAIYLCVICILPTLLMNNLALPFFFGGTSLLILVSVSIDTSQQIQSHMLTAKYENLKKGMKVRSRRVQY